MICDNQSRLDAANELLALKAEHLRRVDELLASNNQLRDRAIKAEREREEAERLASSTHRAAVDFYERMLRAESALQEREFFIHARGLWQEFAGA